MQSTPCNVGSNMKQRIQYILFNTFQIFDLGSKVIFASLCFIILSLHSYAVFAKHNSIISGTYTVGSGGDFTTLTDAINSYNNSSLNGHVVLILTNTIYSIGETFPLIIKKNSSASVAATLTIRPAANVTSTISGSVAYGALLRILGDYIFIDGSNNGTNSRNLTITNTSVIQPRVVLFGSVGTSPVTNCGIKNCNLINGTSDRSVVLISDTTMNPPLAGYFSNITVENNSFKRAIYGIYCNAVPVILNGSGLKFLSNDLSNAGSSDSIQLCGIYLEGTDGVLIKDNKIGNFKRLDSASDKGIFISADVKNTKVIGNNIFNINNTADKGCGAHGIYIGTGILNANIVVANNMISNISADGNDHTSGVFNVENPAGIILNSSSNQSGISIYHNSIYLGGVVGFTNTLNKPGAISACIRLKSGSTANIRNNILVNNLGLKDSIGFGATVIMVTNGTSQFSQLDYNDYSVNPTGSRGYKLFGFIYNTGTRATTLSSWRSATSKEGAGVNILPQFISSTDLHILNSSNNALNNLGYPIAGYDVDIDNTSRNLISPDMGCDEFVPANTANWIGKYSSSWSDAFNWEANVKPDASRDIVMRTGNPYLARVYDSAEVRNITLSGASNAVLISLDSNAVFRVNGTLTKNNGYIDASSGIFCLNGSNSQSVPANLFLDNKVVNLEIGNSSLSGVALLGTLDVYQTLNFSASGYKLNTNGNLTLKSTENTTASVGNLTGKIINGDVTIERYIPTGLTHAKSWQFLSVPVNGSQTINQAWQDSATAFNQNRYPGFGTTITSNLGTNTAGCNALGFDFFTPAGGTLKTYSATDSSWVGVSSTLIPIGNKKGYFVFVRGDRSVITSTAAAVPTVLRAKGKLYTATSGELPPITTVAANRFESVGNPYASAIDFRNINRPDNTVDNTFYVWDPLLAGSYNLGGFQTISSVNGYRPIPGGTSNYNNAIPCTTIQSGQAFFVHATGANSGGTISFSESAKTIGSKATFRNDNVSTPQSFINTLLYTATGINDKMADGNFIVLDGNENNGYDSHDALKLLNSGENFGINACSKKLTVESRSMPLAGDTFHFVMSNLKKQNYQLRIAAVGLINNEYTAVLLDKYNGIETIISNVDTTFNNFNVNDNLFSSASDRFKIIFKTVQALPVDFISVNGFLLTDGSKKIKWEVGHSINIDHYEIERSNDGSEFSMIGNVISNNQLNYQFTDEGKESGKLFYRIRAVENGGSYYFSKSVVVDNVANSGFVICQNPVEGNFIHLKIGKKIPNGNYSWKIINQIGQTIQKSDLLVDNNTTLLNLFLHPSILSGNYKLVISDNNRFMEMLHILLQ
jgi:hypothetical protein